MTSSPSPNASDSLVCGCIDLGACSPFSAAGNTEVEEKETKPLEEVSVVTTGNSEWKKISRDDLTASTADGSARSNPSPEGDAAVDADAKADAAAATVGSKKKKGKRSRFGRKIRHSLSKKNSVKTEVKRLKVW